MSSIETYLQYIANKIFARDVRTAIINAIRQCYDDVHNPTLNTEALQAALQAKIDAGQMAALAIGDRTITAAKLALGVIPTPDATLSQSGVPADAKTTGDEINAINESLENLEPGLSATAKAALLECIRHIARWDDDNGETYYNNLYEALYGVPIIAPVFRYNPASDGLLSTQDYVESATINEGASESLVNGKLVLSAAKGASQSVSSYAQFVMDEYDNVYGRLKARAKISATKFTPDTHISGSFRVEVSNATKGAQFYIMETNQGYLKVEYVVGTTRTAVTTTIEAEQYHDFEFIAKGDTQKLIIDGTTVVNANGLSTQYVSTVRMWAMSGSSNTDIQLTIDSVEYYDEEG